MGRPFIEYIQSQAVPWRNGLPGGSHAGVKSRLLSMDLESTASSMLIKYPAGWSDPNPHHLNVDDEFLVLSGELEIGDTSYQKYSFGHLPAGFQRSSARTLTETVVLTFRSGEGTRLEGSSAMDESRLVNKVDALADQWGGNFHPKFPPGAGRKYMRQDQHDGEETWILGTMPLRSGRRPEKHPVVEEMYLLAGSLVGPRGVMHAGAYFWRPEEEWHGPFGSLTGNLMLFRTKGGPLSTVYTDHEVDFSWTPPNDPILPPDMAQYASGHGDGQSCF